MVVRISLCFLMFQISSAGMYPWFFWVPWVLMRAVSRVWAVDGFLGSWALPKQPKTAGFDPCRRIFLLNHFVSVLFDHCFFENPILELNRDLGPGGCWLFVLLGASDTVENWGTNSLPATFPHGPLFGDFVRVLKSDFNSGHC